MAEGPTSQIVMAIRFHRFIIWIQIKYAHGCCTESLLSSGAHIAIPTIASPTNVTLFPQLQRLMKNCELKPGF